MAQATAPIHDTTQETDCRELPIRSLSEAQRTCREVVGRVDPTLLTHLGSGVCIAAVEMMLICMGRGEQSSFLPRPSQSRIATRSSVNATDRSK